ncbi:DEAD/DEAH box helicase [Buchnera aphidicola]|uniref:DEAD/DEAH box helicase n=1 Tax=Buchnera aphidicola TaxID=9 RepID=UPI0030ECA0C6
MIHVNTSDFLKFKFKDCLLKVLKEIGYEKPSPIQMSCIPYLLKDRDVLGMAQTGSGKTAAFALPLLQKVNISLKFPQILVLTPTRELAVQVSKAFSLFSKYLYGVKVLALYGGQRYEVQLKSLRYGPQIVVGTPGRLLDHLKRKTLCLSHLSTLVLDEADEMLRMGFIEDVENILSNIPKNHQTALFSATMPEIIRKISRRFMNNPKEIKIVSNLNNRPNILQTYWLVCRRKTDALIRFLEVEDYSATIIFVRTKSATLEVSEALEKNGYNSAALNGDMNQNLREQTLDRLRKGSLDILIATDVAARGLDVDKISLVINYDIPMDVESYVHRIGRTGRAGRLGKALLFVEYRELRLLKNIERITRQKIQEVKIPTIELLSKKRLYKFSKKIEKELKNVKEVENYKNILSKIKPKENPISIEILAAVLLKIAQKNRPLILKPDLNKNFSQRNIKFYNTHNQNRNIKKNINFYSKNLKKFNNFDLYKISLGRKDRVEARHIVGAIANESKISSNNIGHVRIYENYSTIELVKSLKNNKFFLKNLKNTKIFNKLINLNLYQQKNYYFKNKNFKKKVFNKKFN